MELSTKSGPGPALRPPLAKRVGNKTVLGIKLGNGSGDGNGSGAGGGADSGEGAAAAACAAAERNKYYFTAVTLWRHPNQVVVGLLNIHFKILYIYIHIYVFIYFLKPSFWTWL